MNNKLNETMQRLDRAFCLLSEIFVHKGDVEIMSQAKRELQAAYSEMEWLKRKLEAKEANDGSVD